MARLRPVMKANAKKIDDGRVKNVSADLDLEPYRDEPDFLLFQEDDQGAMRFRQAMTDRNSVPTLVRGNTIRFYACY